MEVDIQQIGLHAWVSKLDGNGSTPLQRATAGNHTPSQISWLRSMGKDTKYVSASEPLLQTWDIKSLDDAEGGTRGLYSLELAEWLESGTVLIKDKK